MNNENQTIYNYNQIKQQYLNYPTTIIYNKIRSLRHNFNAFILSIKQMISKIKIIILLETNINDCENFYKIKGFNLVFFNREGRGRPIAVYVKENIEFTQISPNTNSFQIVHFNVKIGNETIALLSSFGPPSQNINTFL